MNPRAQLQPIRAPKDRRRPIITAALWTLLAFAALATGLPREAVAYSFVMMADADLVAQSDGAAVVTVTGQPVPVRSQDGSIIATRYRLVVDDMLAGAVGAAEWLELPGSVFDGEPGWDVVGMPRLQDGAELLVLFQRRGDDVLVPSQLLLGLFGRNASGSLWQRALTGSGLGPKDLHTEVYSAPRDDAGFRAFLRAAFAGQSGLPDYLRPDAATEKFGIQSAEISSVVRDIRWNRFDQGLGVGWKSTAGGQTAALNSDGMLMQGIAAWTGDAGSNINYSFTGNHSEVTFNAAAQPTGDGYVYWNDPSAQIPGTYNCATGGSLGFGGTSFSNATHVYAQTGISHYTTQKAFIVIQDGAACFMNGPGISGANGAELLAHELGHTLSFLHSCGDSNSPPCNSSTLLDDALMRAVAHGDGRGAELKVDDRDAARYLYFGAAPPVVSIFKNGFE